MCIFEAFNVLERKKWVWFKETIILRKVGRFPGFRFSFKCSLRKSAVQQSFVDLLTPQIIKTILQKSFHSEEVILAEERTTDGERLHIMEARFGEINTNGLCSNNISET